MNKKSGFFLAIAAVAMSVGINGEDLNGTGGDDTLNGSNGNDIIDGKGGNDTINGLAGQDVLTGGTGADTIDGGDGPDTIYDGESSSSGPDGDEDSVSLKDGFIDTAYIGAEDTIKTADDDDLIRVWQSGGGVVFAGTYLQYVAWKNSQPI